MLIRTVSLTALALLSFSRPCMAQQAYQITFHSPNSPQLGGFDFHAITLHQEAYYVVGSHLHNMQLRLRLGKFALSGDSIASTYLSHTDGWFRWVETKVVASDELVTLALLQAGNGVDSLRLGQRIIRHDTLGNVLWDTTLMSPDVLYELYSFRATADQGLILTGKITQNKDADAFWMKWDSVGNEVWTQHIPDTTSQAYGATLLQRPNNTIWMPVQRTTDSVHYLDLVTIDHKGQVISTKSWPTGKFTLIDAEATMDGGMLAWGYAAHGLFPWKYNLSLYKFRNDGTLQYQRTHTLPWKYYTWMEMVPTADSGFVLVGSGGERLVNSNQQPNSVWLKIDKEGDIVWHRDYWKKLNDFICQDAVIHSNGTITGVGGIYPSAYILHLDAMGCYPGPCDTCPPLPEVTSIQIQVKNIQILPGKDIRVTLALDTLPKDIWKIWTYREGIARDRSAFIHSTDYTLYFDRVGTYPVCLGLLNECGDYRDTCFMLNVFPLGVDEKEVPDIKLFPNPADKFLHVQLPQLLGAAQLEVIATDGRRMGFFELNTLHTTISTSSFSSGLYVALIRDQHGDIRWRSTFMVK